MSDNINIIENYLYDNEEAQENVQENIQGNEDYIHEKNYMTIEDLESAYVEKQDSGKSLLMTADALKKDVLKSAYRDASIRRKQDRNAGLDNFYSLKSTQRDIKRINFLLKSGNINVDKDYYNLQVRQSRNMSHMLLNNEAMWDSKYMGKIKTTLNEVESNMSLLRGATTEQTISDQQFTQMLEAYNSAMEACRSYCKNRNPWFSKGKQRLAAVKEVLENLEKEYGEICVGRDLVKAGVFKAAEASNFPDLLTNARYYMSVGEVKSREDVKVSKKQKAGKNVEAKPEKVQAIPKEVKPFVDVLNGDKTPSEYVKTAGDKAVLEFKAILSALREIPFGKAYVKSLYINNNYILLCANEDNELTLRAGNAEFSLTGSPDELISYMEDDMVRNEKLFGKDVTTEAILHYANKDFKNLKDVTAGEIINARQLMTELILRKEKIAPELLYNVPTYELIDLAKELTNNNIKSTDAIGRINKYQGGDKHSVALVAEAREITAVLAKESKEERADKVKGLTKTNLDEKVIELSIGMAQEKAKANDEDYLDDLEQAKKELLVQKQKELDESYGQLPLDEQPDWYRDLEEAKKGGNVIFIKLAEIKASFSKEKAELTEEDIQKLKEEKFKEFITNKYDEDENLKKERSEIESEAVRSFLGDLLFNPEQWDADGKALSPKERIQGVITKHVNTLVYLMDNPERITEILEDLAISAIIPDDKKEEFQAKIKEYTDTVFGKINGVLGFFADNPVKKAEMIKASYKLIGGLFEQADEKINELVNKCTDMISDKLLEHTENAFGKAEKNKTVFTRTETQNANALEAVRNTIPGSIKKIKEVKEKRIPSVRSAFPGEIDVVSYYYKLKVLGKYAKDKSSKELCKNAAASVDLMFEQIPLYFSEDIIKDASCKTASETGKFRHLYENDQLIQAGSKLKLFKVIFAQMLDAIENKKGLTEKQKKVEMDNIFERIKTEVGEPIQEIFGDSYPFLTVREYYDNKTPEALTKSVNDMLKMQYGNCMGAYEHYEALIEFGQGRMSLSKEEMDAVKKSVEKLNIQIPQKLPEQENWTDQELLDYAKKKALDDAVAAKKEEKAQEHRKKLANYYVLNSYKAFLENTSYPLKTFLLLINAEGQSLDALQSWFDDKNNYGTEFEAAVRKYRNTKYDDPEAPLIEAEVARLYMIISKNRYNLLRNEMTLDNKDKNVVIRNLTKEEEDRVLSATQTKDLKSADGLGGFYKNIFDNYFREISEMDKRAILASLIRTKKVVKLDFEGKEDQKAAMGLVFGAALKGCGPLLQKIMQAIPADNIPELATALKDVKDNLAPLPPEYVEAQLAGMVQRSKGKVTKIELVKSLGAASVGQAFFCKAYGPKLPQEGKTIVVKLLRPDIQNKMKREEKIMLDAAESTNKGMVTTYEGQMKNIRREMDLRIEAENIEKGQIYSKGSAIEKKVKETDDVKSVKIEALIAPTQNALALELASGDTVSGYIEDVEKFRKELGKDNFIVKRTGDGRIVRRSKEEKNADVEDIESINLLQQQAVEKLEEMKKRQSHLAKVADKWIYEALFGSGFYHGDLHAGNIMISDDEATVIDFGNATQLSKEDQSCILKFMAASAMSDSANMEEAFINLLSEAGKAQLNKNGGQLHAMIEKVAKMGTIDGTISRLYVIMSNAQKLGFEMPASIYNFLQCMCRLTNTVKEMNIEVEKLDSDLYDLTQVRKQLKVPKDTINPDQQSLIPENDKINYDWQYRDHTKMLLQSYGTVDKDEFLQELRGEDTENFKETYMIGINDDIDSIKNIVNKVIDPASGVKGKFRTKKGKEKIDRMNTYRRGTVNQYMEMLIEKSAIFMDQEEINQVKTRWGNFNGLSNVEFIAQKSEVIAFINTFKDKDELDVAYKALLDAKKNKKTTADQKEQLENQFFEKYKTTIKNRASKFNTHTKFINAFTDPENQEERDAKFEKLKSEIKPLFKEKGGTELEAAFNEYETQRNAGLSAEELKPFIEKIEEQYNIISSRRVKTVLKRWIQISDASLDGPGSLHDFEGAMGSVLEAKWTSVPGMIGFFRTGKYVTKLVYQKLFGDEVTEGDTKLDDAMVRNEDKLKAEYDNLFKPVDPDELDFEDEGEDEDEKKIIIPEFEAEKKNANEIKNENVQEDKKEDKKLIDEEIIQTQIIMEENKNDNESEKNN
ncbi:Predicted unusual protein kinase regulating ubiquinone biosynthesis, AarF/ABC1/UbiB family [Pseudobutyrivibrio sp. JW11]|uniref:AarF/UbiB family protein n=1 Tax=Pseudobutyrivibrio sp. JW11 TaxID=1855302 RepID=UPI0008E7773B|nr:AarF/UbiB family protein [Pseudobutyrivibrio sp. JW11]SFN82884.1 Predicted unusual protein kinase regulating ubiquinone biosynthesis, AarF/ABC1/UbiB family [Pseudobutyrivibrio sp. JW11]